MEEERIEIIKTWPKPQSIKEISVFWSFANFYPRFIQGFDKIAVLLLLILKRTAGVFSPTNVKKSKETSDSAIDNGNKIGSREMGGNLSKINFFKMRFLTSEAIAAFIYL